MKNTTKIGIVLMISLCFFVAEIAVGFRTKSIALIADAFHYLNDIVAYAIAFLAAYLHERGEHTDSFTFAFHRAELVGAFFNGVFLLALALSICLQSIERFVNLETIDSPRLVMIIGCVGLGLNIISIIVVHDHHGHGHGHGHNHANNALSGSTELHVRNTMRDHIHAEHNHRVDPPSSSPQHNLGLLGVLVHVFGDAVNNVGVIVAAVVMWKLKSPHRFYADPAVSMAIGFIIFGSAIPMTLKSGRVLLEATPLHLDLAKVKEDLVTVPYVLSIHDFHVWHLSQTVILASLHVCVPPGTTMEQWEKTELYLQHCFAEYGINHVTISPEIQRDSQTTSVANEEALGKCCMPSSGDFGCAVGELKRRKTGAV